MVVNSTRWLPAACLVILTERLAVEAGACLWLQDKPRGGTFGNWRSREDHTLVAVLVPKRIQVVVVLREGLTRFAGSDNPERVIEVRQVDHLAQGGDGLLS